jgi:hypothetical protein
MDGEVGSLRGIEEEKALAFMEGIQEAKGVGWTGGEGSSLKSSSVS